MTAEYKQLLDTLGASTQEEAMAEIGRLHAAALALHAAALAINNAPKATSVVADFERLTWTFEIDEDCRVAPGTYALVWIPQKAEKQCPP